MIRSVFWDFGGVISESPFVAFKKFEEEQGLPENFIRQINSANPNDNAWAQFERGDISFEEFDTLFEQESEKLGHAIRGTAIIELFDLKLRPQMVEALRRCKRHFRLACLTNNVQVGEVPGMQRSKERAAEVEEVMRLFDTVVESSKVGVRKPNPHFYKMACELSGISPRQVVYLDDLGINLKPAKALGMKTIKVVDPQQALRELEDLLGIPLL